jgi:acetyl-CoA synthetase
MRDYGEAYSSFSLVELERETLSDTLSSGVNACVECCDRWAVGDRIGLHWISRDFKRYDITFATLQRDAARFANLLRSRGIGPGDVVAGLLPKVPELLTAILGTAGRRDLSGAVYRVWPGCDCVPRNRSYRQLGETDRYGPGQSAKA